MSAVIIVVCLLLFGSALGTWVARHRSSVLFAVLYLWLVRLGEAKPKTVESHPDYLNNFYHKEVISVGHYIRINKRKCKKERYRD